MINLIELFQLLYDLKVPTIEPLVYSVSRIEKNRKIHSIQLELDLDF